MAIYSRPDEVQACVKAAAAALAAEVDGTGGFLAIVAGTAVRVRPELPLDILVDAEAAPPPGLRLRVRRGYVYPFGRGVDHVRFGDPEFDDRFVVKANDADYARAWLGRDLRRRLPADYSYEVGPRTVGACFTGAQVDARTLVHAVRTVADLARQGERLLGEWAALAGALGGRVRATAAGWRPDGSAAIDVEQPGASGTIDSLLVGRPARLHTRVSSRRVDVGGDAFAISLRHTDAELPLRLPEVDDASGDLANGFRLHGSDAARLADRLDARVRAAILAVRPPLVLSAGNDVEILFPGWMADASRLRGALEITAALAERPEPVLASGPYR